MKKITFLLSFICFHAFSQDALVKISPFHFADGTIYASYERAFSDNNSFTLSGGYRLSDNGDEYGWMGEFQIRKYIFKPAINKSSESKLAGVYGGLYLNGKYFVENHFTYDYLYDDYEYFEKNHEYDIKQTEGGVLMGFQIIFSQKMSLDLFFGGGLRNSQIDNKPNELNIYNPERGYTGIVPKIGFDIGIAL